MPVTRASPRWEASLPCGHARPGQSGRGESDRPPHERILEEAAVRERVDEDDDQRRAERERERPVECAQAEHGQRRRPQEEDVDGGAEDPELGRDRERGRVRRGSRAAALTPDLACGALLAADPDAEDGVVADHLGGVGDDVRTAAREPAGGLVPGEHDDERRRRDRCDCGCCDEDAPAARVGREEAHDEDADKEREHARLRIRDEEPGPGQRDQRDRHGQADPPHPEERDRDRDRDGEVASVDRRVVEEGRHARERRVGVRHLDVGGEVQIFGEELAQADEREDRGECEQRDGKAFPSPRGQRRPRDDGEERDEREVEEDEVRAGAALVGGPEHRERGEPDEERGRAGEEQGRSREFVTAQRADDQRRGGGHEHRVEREQEVEALVADVERDPQRRRDEQGDGRDVRAADEARAESRHDGDAEGEAEGMRGQCIQFGVREEQQAEPHFGGGQDRESAEQRDARRGECDQCGAEPSREGGQFCCRARLHRVHDPMRRAGPDGGTSAPAASLP